MASMFDGNRQYFLVDIYHSPKLDYYQRNSIPPFSSRRYKTSTCKSLNLSRLFPSVFCNHTLIHFYIKRAELVNASPSKPSWYLKCKSCLISSPPFTNSTYLNSNHGIWTLGIQLQLMSFIFILLTDCLFPRDNHFLQCPSL